MLVLGAGGGSSVLQALYHQAIRIDVVELDPNMVRLVGEDYAQYAGRHLQPARNSGATWPKRAVRQLKQAPVGCRADSAIGCFGSARRGYSGLSETYIYTVEAFEHYLQRLRPGGWLSITRWLKLPPRDALKLFATALEALRRLGIENPEQRLVLLRGLNTTTLLVKNGVVTGHGDRQSQGLLRTSARSISAIIPESAPMKPTASTFWMSPTSLQAPRL